MSGEGDTYVALEDDESPPKIGSKNQRYLALVCAACYPVGAHVCYKMTSGIEKDMVASMGINDKQYGYLNSAVSYSGLALIPFAAGFLVDSRPTGHAAVLFSLLTLVGHIVFTLAVSSDNFTGALVGRTIFGIGESTVMVAQGTMCAQWFRSKDQLALAIGVTEMTHNLGNWLGKVAINVGLAWGGWKMTMWFGTIICILGVGVAVAYLFLERSGKRDVLHRRDGFDRGEEGTVSVQGHGGAASAVRPLLDVLLSALPRLQRGAPL